ncbi:MAG: hypothetical protein WBC05_12975, partial [Sedimentisphaerales bacterium]
RMLLYERRIENSLHKTINRLKTQQMIRVIQQADARKQETAQAIPSTALRASPEPVEGTGPKACGFEAATQSNSPSQSETATRPAEKHVDLKKQTQFTTVQVDAKSFEKEDYGNEPVCGVEENKANQSQFPAPEPTEGAGKRDKSLAAATG